MEAESSTPVALPPDVARAKESVVVLVPFGGYFDPRFYQTSMTATIVAEKSGLDIRAVICSWREVVQAARNHLAKAFLESNADWAMWMDSDMVFPPDAIIKLWRWAKRLNAKWMTGCYYQRFAPHQAVMFRLPPRSALANGHKRYYHEHTTYADGRKYPFEVDCAGFGCMLTHRSIFEKMAKPYFKFTTNADNEEEESSEDFYFSVKARAAGHVLYACPEVECGHIPEANPITRADYVRCRKTEDMIEVKEEYKEKPINGQQGNPAGTTGADAVSSPEAGPPKTA